MTLADILTPLQDSALAALIRETDVVFMGIETLHVLAIATVTGSIAMVDLRLLGRVAVLRPVSQLSAEILPWTWSAFAVAVATGGLMFISSAARYADNGPLQLKLALIVAAGINMMVFHTFAYRSVAEWDEGRPAPVLAKVCAGLSLALWLAVVAAGRWIGFAPTGGSFG